jgi:EAL domain-containing protein (putative c-di-GMP-specific phosphodiesterase class I)
LARWCHPTRGLLLPGAFIPIAEETGLITTITEWAIADACRQLARWRVELGELAPPTVNVNLTTRDLRDPGLLDRIALALTEAAIPPSSLRLEITERVLIEELREAAGTLQAIRDLGVKLAIDDFGAGASSLASLRAVHVEVLKLDRAFVRGMEDNPDDRIVVNAVVAMAHALGIAVTAEGIETVAQREQARAAGCDRGQGYLFAEPMPAEALTSWLIMNDTQPATDGIHLMFDGAPSASGFVRP